MTPEEMRALYAYEAWANHRLLDACAALTEEQFTRDLGSSYPSIHDTLVHILGGQWFWLERWRGRSPSASPKQPRFPDPESLRASWQAIERDLLEFVGGLAQDDLMRVLHYRTTEGNPNSQPYWQMLQHVVNHGTYHRGQVTLMLRQLGATPAATDLILYYREHDGKLREIHLAPVTIRLLYQYNAWANQRMLEASAQLAGDQFTRDLGSSFPSVRDTLEHILGAEWIWLERWQGRSPQAVPFAKQYRNLAEFRGAWSEHETQLSRFVAGCTAEDLARVYEFRTLKGAVYPNSLSQAMQHLANHGSYHRGQVAAMLRQLGAKPNFTDLIYFYRERAGQALD